MRTTFAASLLIFVSAPAFAVSVVVSNRKGQPLAGVMVTVKAEKPRLAGTSDNGYPTERERQTITPEITGFTGTDGRVEIPYAASTNVQIRARRIGFKDVVKSQARAGAGVNLTMDAETDPTARAAQEPSNHWVGALDFGTDVEAKMTYLEQCGFCHQQGTPFLRRNRPSEDWDAAMKRMIQYGARPSSDVQKRLPELLSRLYADLNEHPERVPSGPDWASAVGSTRIVEFPLGDKFSQMHDLLLHSNGKVYVGDNLNDRLWEVDPRTGSTVVYKMPRDDGDDLGGLFTGRLKTFPRHESYIGLHSLAEAPNDGHIFTTPSLQKRIVEFDPTSGTFVVHHFDTGLYPHTIRVDGADRVWFTLALSNQVGMLERKTGEFKTFDLPPRSFKEKISLKLNRVILKLLNWGMPMHWLSIDKRVSGMPLPYGIDVAPNGSVWFTRLHADTIGTIDPKTGDVKMIDTPFQGPRRLRIDAENVVWITAFPEGKIFSYHPVSEKFTGYDLPTKKNGVETPYSLNVDRARARVWVTGTASDTLIRFDIRTKAWAVFPLPRRVTFTRDIEIAKDGSVYTANGLFPSWHIEDAQPTLIHLIPGR